MTTVAVVRPSSLPDTRTCETTAPGLPVLTMTPLIKPIDLSIGNVKSVGPLSIAMVTTSPAATIVSYVAPLGVQGGTMGLDMRGVKKSNILLTRH